MEEKYIVKNGRRLYERECFACKSVVYKRIGAKAKFRGFLCKACSKSCHNPRPSAKCGQCGEGISRPHSKFKGSKSGNYYCSNKCAAQYRSDRARDKRLGLGLTQ